MPAAATTQRQAIAEYREALRQELAALHTRIAPPAGNRISLKGRVFTMPDGSIHAGPIGAVILDFRNHNSFWSTPYNPQQLTDPVCFALSREFGDLAPSADATTPQAEHCAVCPRNVFGSAANGKAKRCKNARRLAIVPPDATLETAPMLLDASPTAISAFESYLLGLATEGRMPVEVTTLIAFKPDADYPSLVFGKPRPLTDKQLATMIKLREKAQAMLDMTGARAANDEAGS
jgi:hypothetical protein